MPNRKKQKAGSRAKHRLLSIHRDTRAIQDLFFQSQNQERSLITHALSQWKLIANERCGSWYIPPVIRNHNSNTVSKSSSCYFKSTDGHVNVWDFSLKRLNLHLLEQTIAVDGGCVLVDSSVRKLLPDSFSKTIPIWAAVLNNFVLQYSSDADSDRYKGWDTSVYTPQGVISKDEHDNITGLIDERANTLLKSGAIVNPKQLVETLTKPLRVVWMNHEGKLYASNGDKGNSTTNNDHLEDLLEKYFLIVCWNPSRYSRKPETTTKCEAPKSDLHCNDVIALKKHQTEWIAHDDDEPNSKENSQKLHGYYYTPGSADDEESWALDLTPDLFWKNQEALLDPALDDDGIDALIDILVTQERNAQQERERHHRISNGDNCNGDLDKVAMETVYSYSNKIGNLNLWIGSRRASRPPECWSGFDAILNVTNQEYESMIESTNKISKEPKNRRFYLRLPVEEGKRDRTQLEKWMPVGLTFLMHHLQAGRRVLVHCAQGKDRSVAVALVFVTMTCPLQFPLRHKPEFTSHFWDLSTLGSDESECDKVEADTDENENEYLSSGLPEAAVRRILDTGGREAFLLWVHQNNETKDSNSEQLHCFANKEGVRIALHLIKQDREVADPTRATMQKINRFLMSSLIYR